MSPAEASLCQILSTLADICDERANKVPFGFGKLEVTYYETSDCMRSLVWAIRDEANKRGTNEAIPFDVEGDEGGAEKEGSQPILP